MVNKESVLEANRKANGKYEILAKVRIATRDDLATFYTPGVAFVSEAIKENGDLVYDYTGKANTIAIVSDGTRILGLGNIGPKAGLPVMEGKAMLFKRYGAVDAVPLCVSTTDENKIIELVKDIAPTFGAVNIEDIEAPKSLRIVRRLSDMLDIPVFHDDQEGTAVVVLAGLLNALKLVGKKRGEVKVVINGSGSAGIGITKLLHHAKFTHLYVVDSAGLVYKGRKENMNEFKEEIAAYTNTDGKHGDLAEAAKGADVLIGVSQRGAFSLGMIHSMASKPIVFALANPLPEIEYTEARDAGAYIVATGSSSNPNQVNNLLAFPGIMRGLLDARAKHVNSEILYDAALEIAKGVGRRLSPEYIIPDPIDHKLAIKTVSNVASAVAYAAVRTGVARVHVNKDEVRKHTAFLIKRYMRIEKKALK